MQFTQYAFHQYLFFSYLEIQTVVSKIAKEKGCEPLSERIKPCINRFCWSATSTVNGNGQKIWAKFESFLHHIINEHNNLPNVLFNKCADDEKLTHRKWLTKGIWIYLMWIIESQLAIITKYLFIQDSDVYGKVQNFLTKKNLKNGISHASSLGQTSCLEEFHSLLNHFSPKRIVYSYQGMYCRFVTI